jgi:hypothetical protein
LEVSLFIDHQFVAQVGFRLERFKRKNQKTYNFRCPFCKDSAKSKIKARGYFYVRGNDIFFKCHNCMKSWTLAHFLQEFDPQIHERYIFDRYTKGENGHSNYAKPSFDEFAFKPNFSDSGHSPICDGSILLDLPNINALPDYHRARNYLVNRRIPAQYLDQFFWCQDFKRLVNKIDPEIHSLRENEERIIIPFYDVQHNLIAIQGRILGDVGLRYITVKVNKDAPKLYGMDRVDLSKRVYIFEGPFDSLFIPNSIATAGASITELRCIPNRVFVYDNERRKSEIVGAMIKKANDGEEVVVWPDTIREKDINAMILSGKTSTELISILEDFTFKGLQARVKIMDWKRC